MKKKQMTRLALSKTTITNLHLQAAAIKGGQEAAITSIGYECSVRRTCTRLSNGEEVCQLCTIPSGIEYCGPSKELC
jgi:hypothetical protein